VSGVHRPALLGLTSAAALLGSAGAVWRWTVTPDGWPPVLHGPLPALVGTTVASTALLGVVMAWQLTVATRPPSLPIARSTRRWCPDRPNPRRTGGPRQRPTGHHHPGRPRRRPQAHHPLPHYRPLSLSRC